MVDRESTETMMPSLNLNASVVVPLACLMAWWASPDPQVDAKLLRQNDAGLDTFGTEKLLGRSSVWNR